MIAPSAIPDIVENCPEWKVQLTITSRLQMPQIGKTQDFLIFTASMLSFHILCPSHGTLTKWGHFCVYITPICQTGIADSRITSDLIAYMIRVCGHADIILEMYS